MSDFGHWLAGFVDGEGCFRILANNHGNVYPRFCIMLRQDDGPVLDTLSVELGIGSVKRRKTYNNSAPGVVFQVDKHNELMVLVDLFDEHPLRARKGEQFAVWRQAVLARDAIRGKRLTTEQRDALNATLTQYAADLAALRVYREVPECLNI